MLSLHEKNNIYMFFCTEYGLTKFTRGYTEHSFKCLHTGSDHMHTVTQVSCPVTSHLYVDTPGDVQYQEEDTVVM